MGLVDLGLIDFGLIDLGLIALGRGGGGGGCCCLLKVDILGLTDLDRGVGAVYRCF